MTRPLAISGAIFCLGMIFPVVLTDPSRGDVVLPSQILHMACVLIMVFSLIGYCGFAALHSVYHVKSPHERTGWLIFILGLNVLGSLVYYLTKYQDFRLNRKGGIPRSRVERSGSFFRASKGELDLAPGVPGQRT